MCVYVGVQYYAGQFTERHYDLIEGNNRVSALGLASSPTYGRDRNGFSLDGAAVRVMRSITKEKEREGERKRDIEREREREMREREREREMREW